MAITRGPQALVGTRIGGNGSYQPSGLPKPSGSRGQAKKQLTTKNENKIRQQGKDHVKHRKANTPTKYKNKPNKKSSKTNQMTRKQNTKEKRNTQQKPSEKQQEQQITNSQP